MGIVDALLEVFVDQFLGGWIRPMFEPMLESVKRGLFTEDQWEAFDEWVNGVWDTIDGLLRWMILGVGDMEDFWKGILDRIGERVLEAIYNYLANVLIQMGRLEIVDVYEETDLSPQRDYDDTSNKNSGIIESIVTLVAIMFGAITFSDAPALPPISIPSSPSKVTAKPATRTLDDVTTSIPAPAATIYQFAYTGKSGALVMTGGKLTFYQAMFALGFASFANVLTTVFTFSLGSATPFVQRLDKEHPRTWGIYTPQQSDAKALAIVVGATSQPEVHKDYYGHYHDSTHSFHIWYGTRVSY